jgi:hypothetical protein
MVETGQEKKKLSKYVNCSHTAGMYDDRQHSDSVGWGRTLCGMNPSNYQIDFRAWHFLLCEYATVLTTHRNTLSIIALLHHRANAGEKTYITVASRGEAFKRGH